MPFDQMQRVDSENEHPERVEQDAMAEKVNFEKEEYFCAIKVIAKYIADHVKELPEEDRERYLNMAYGESTRNIKEYTEEFINDPT